MALKEEWNDVDKQIKDLLQHLTPMIHIGGSSENSLDMLLYLSEIDPNFHKLELVKFLRMRLRGSLSSVIESYVSESLKNQNGKMREDNIVDNLSKELLKDEAFLELKGYLETALKSGVQDIIAKAEENDYEDFDVNIKEKHGNKLSPTSSNETSLNSSLNQSGYLFINPAQYENIAESLKKKHLSENTHNALNLLLSVTPGEPVSQTLWPSIRKSLKEFLQTGDDEIFDKSLRIHARLLSSQVHNAVKEGFMNIAEALSGFWLSKKLLHEVPNKSSMISLEGNKVMILVKILLQFLKDFPALIIRYPSHYITETIGSFLSLFATHNTHKKEEKLCFCDIVCLLDPQAAWFLAWTHSQFGRKKIFHGLHSEPSLLTSSLTFYFKYVEQHKSCVVKIQQNQLNLQGLNFFKFNFSLNIIFSVIRYTDGKIVFPLYDNLKKEHYSLKKILYAVINTVKTSSQFLTIKIILDNLSNICISNDNICKLFCDFGIVDSLMQVIELQKNVHFSQEKIVHFQLILDFLHSINSSSIGHEFLLIGRSQKGSKVHLNASTQTPAQRIFTFLCIIFESNIVLSDKMIQTCISLASSILSSPLGKHLLLNDPLIILLSKSISEHYNPSKRYSSEYEKVDSNATIQIVNLAIKKFIYCQEGLQILQKQKLMIPVLNYILPQLAVDGGISNRLLDSIVYYNDGCLALERNSIVKPFWHLLEHIIERESICQSPSAFDQLNETLENSIIPLLCLCSTFQGIKLLFSDGGLLAELISSLEESSNTETAFYSLALKLLSVTYCNLNGFVYIRSSFKFEEILSKQQEDLVDGILIQDENSILRSQILCTFHSFRERKNQPTNTSVEPQNMKTSSDKSSLVKNVDIALTTKQSSLRQFIDETRSGVLDLSWISLCRKAYRDDVTSLTDIKMSTLLDTVELTLGILSTSPEELYPCDVMKRDVRAHDLIESSREKKIPSVGSATSFNNSVFCYSAPESLSSSSSSSNDDDYDEEADDCSSTIGTSWVATETKNPAIGRFGDNYSHSLTMEMMIKYGVANNLIRETSIQRSDLLKLHLSIAYFSVSKMDSRFDGFFLLIFCLAEGNIDKSSSLFHKFRDLKMGSVLWPNLMRCRRLQLDARDGDVVLTLLHCTKLVLYRESQTVFIAIDDFCGGIIWNFLSEWVSSSFVDVLPWPTNLHVGLLVPLLHGQAYLVYVLVSVLIHVQEKLGGRSRLTKLQEISFIQREAVCDFSVDKYLCFMDSLDKRFHRVVKETLNKVFAKKQ